MAKRTSLEIFNKVLTNIGEPTVSALTSLTGLQIVVWDKILESIYDVATEAQWRPLMGTASLALVTGTNTYAISTDLWTEDIYSFRQPDSNITLDLSNDIEWDLAYPSGISSSSHTGYPTKIRRRNDIDYYELNAFPTTAENGKKIPYRYWKRPTLWTTSSTTGTCWFPEGFDDLVLVNQATYKVLAYKNNPEAQEYWYRVNGRRLPGGDMEEGFLSKMKRIYAHDAVNARPIVTYNF